MLAADLETTQRPGLPKTNVSKKTELQKRFDLDLKEEIGKLEVQMRSKGQIEWSTLKSLGEHIRATKYPNEEELKKLKFSKTYLMQFIKPRPRTFRPVTHKPVGPVSGPNAPSFHPSIRVSESTAASCKIEINDDVAVLMEAPGQEVNHKRRISYQKNELHEPTNDQLSGYLNDRIEIIEINTDETEETNSESHQKGTFTCQKNMKKFQEKIISNI